MPYEIDPKHLEELCPTLRPLLDAEIAAGNEVLYTHKGVGSADAIFVMLRHPFRAAGSARSAAVTFADVNDPHWWKAEYKSTVRPHTLACGFGN